jgi:hypothetical protein
VILSSDAQQLLVTCLRAAAETFETDAQALRIEATRRAKEPGAAGMRSMCDHTECSIYGCAVGA